MRPEAMRQSNRASPIEKALAIRASLRTATRCERSEEVRSFAPHDVMRRQNGVCCYLGLQRSFLSQSDAAARRVCLGLGDITTRLCV